MSKENHSNHSPEITLATIQPGTDPTRLAVYSPIPEDEIPDALARLSSNKQECLYVLSAHPGWTKKAIAEKAGLSPITLDNYLSHDPSFHSAWYTVMALARSALAPLTIATAQASALEGIRKAIDYGDTLKPGDKGSEANSKLRAIEIRLKVAGILKDSPPVVFNAGQILVEVARERPRWELEKGRDPKDWDKGY